MSLNSLKWKPFPAQQKFKLMSCVGWENIIGRVFQSHCDWCIGARYPSHDPVRLYGNPNILPKTIYLSIRNIKFFMSSIFELIPEKHRYILIIGNEDMTFPNQTDLRWEVTFIEYFSKLYLDKRVSHIFSNNLDIQQNDKVTALPLGFDGINHSGEGFKKDSHFNVDWILSQSPNVNILNKPLRVRAFNRIRQGPQWDDRVTVRNLSKTSWRSFVDYGEFPNQKICEVLNNYSFTFCAKGGGLEPNPKAFTSIYCGVIPIIKRFVNCDILYEGLPIVFIDEWEEDLVNIQKLEKWRDELSGFFYEKREKVLYRLTVDYWKEYIEKKSKTKIWK
jgi:hypothetical protein